MQVLLPVFLIGVIGSGSLSGGKRRIFALFYCVILAIVAFSFQPHVSDDLYREFENLRGIQKYGWEYFTMKTNQYVSSSKFEGLYLTQLYYYVMSLFPSVHFLPAITTFIVYYLQFSLIEKVSKRYDLSQTETFCLYVFVLCTRETYMIMSGIRNQLAYTIVGYFLYMDLIEKKSQIKSFFIYIAMIFVHQSAVFLFAFRLLLLVNNKKLRIVLSLITLMWSNLLSLMNEIMYRLPQLPIINSLIFKINIYTVNNGGNSNNLILTPRYLIYMISWIPIMIIIIWSIYINKRIIYNSTIVDYSTNCIFWKKLSKGKLLIRSYPCEPSENDIYNISWFLIYNFCFTIGSYMYYWIYLRSAITLGVIGFIPIAILLYNYKNSDNSNNKKNLIYGCFVLCFIKLLIIMFYMNRNMDFSLLTF